MRLRYGNYAHRIAGANISISRVPIENRLKQVIAVEETWNISGRLINKTGSAKGMGPIIAAFEQAYSRGGYDLVLEHSDGSASAHVLRSRDCIGGTQIAQFPAFPDGAAGEYVSYRTFNVAVKGVLPATIGKSMFLEFTETVTISGGGARWGCREVNRGPGSRQRLRTHTTCFATQSGSCTLYLGYPQAPPPIWPYALVDQYPDIEGTGPETQSGGISALTGRALRWSYSFQSPVRLFGEPHYMLP